MNSTALRVRDSSGKAGGLSSGRVFANSPLSNTPK